MMRTPYQIYKEEIPEGSITAFNALSAEENLPYRVMAAEESLEAHALYMTQHPEEQQKYAISAVHSASGYIAQLASFLPIMLRSSTARRLTINFDVLIRVMTQIGLDTNLVHSLAAQHSNGNAISINELGNVESYLISMGQKLRQETKEAGGRIEMLRLKNPIATASSSNTAKSITAPARSNTTTTTTATTEATAGAATGGSSHAESSGDMNAAPLNEVDTVEQTIILPDEEKTKAKRTRKPKSDNPTHVDAEEEASPAAKSRKVELSGATAATSKAPRHGAKSGLPVPVVGAGGTTLATCGRLRQLSTQEKKICGLLQQMIQFLAHVYAVKFNELVTVFDFLTEKTNQLEKAVEVAKQAQAVAAQKEEAQQAAGGAVTKKTNPPGSLELDIPSIRSAISQSNRVFRTDEECQIDFDEDLLHPIVYALVSELNRIEGFLTAPFPEPTEEEKAKKLAAREAARQKREEMRKKAEEKVRLKEAQAAERLRELSLLRQLLGSNEEELVEEDMTAVLPTTPEDLRSAAVQKLPYVHYDAIPFDDVELYQKALFIWSMISSLPRSLQLSRMPFSTFVQGILEDSEENNGLMEEVTGQLRALAKEQYRGTPLAQRLHARGKTWFSALVEFVAEASGNKKKREAPKRQASESSSSGSSSDLEEEEEDEEEENEEDHQDDEEGRSRNENGDQHPSAAKEEAGADGVKKEEAEVEEKHPVETPPPTAPTFEDELRETMESMNELRTRASWGNATVRERLNLLQFCVSEILGTEKAREEADGLQREAEDALSAMEKALREIREDAEKELRKVWRATSTSSSSSGSAAAAAAGGENSRSNGEEVEGILQAVKKKRCVLYATWLQKQDDESVGSIVDPIGMDRFRRLYWRFPLDHRIYVQTTPDTIPNFPLVPRPSHFSMNLTPKARLLLDDEDGAPGPSSAAEGGSPPQTTWGVVPAHFLDSFVEGLDIKGKHEGPLRRSLECMGAQLQRNSYAMPAFTRTTRSRHHMLGYSNSFKQVSFF